MIIYFRGSLIKIPDNLIHSDRERLVMEADVQFRGNNVPLNETIATYLNRFYGMRETKHSVRSIKRRVWRRVARYLTEQAAQKTEGALEKRIVEMANGGDDILNRLREAILKEMGTTYTVQTAISGDLDGPTIIISDLHGSWHPALPGLIQKYNPRNIIIAGDLLDANAALNTRNNPKKRPDYRVKHRRATYISQEIRTVRLLLEILLETTQADIYLMWGNHDIRVVDHMKKVLAPEFWALIRDPFDMIAMGLEERVHVLDPIYKLHQGEFTSNQGYANPYLAKFGNILISHMNFTGAATGESVHKLYNWLITKGWMSALGMTLDDVPVMCQAHTHKLGKVILPGGANVGIELGTMGHPVMFEYSQMYHNNFSPPHYGFAVVDTEDKHKMLQAVRVVSPFISGEAEFNIEAFYEGAGDPFMMEIPEE